MRMASASRCSRASEVARSRGEGLAPQPATASASNKRGASEDQSARRANPMRPRLCCEERVRARGYFLEGLVDLGRLEDRAARRGSFRQSIVLLGQALSASGPGPLEGVDPGALVPAIQVALEDGLFDDLDWLSTDAAAVALYEIASALPPGTEKREV